jgi:RHH-type transcriptional regulator, proline utilization regulon repressor / proline dehydrogenase / delta 1-pyrroline-5-carboxylate dehydrogenase
MEDSSFIQKAQSLIQSAQGKQLPNEALQKAAISLAALMLQEAQRIQTPAEKKQQEQLAGMMNDPIGKVFTTAITDQCFRSSQPKRVAQQLVHVIHKYGVPDYLPLGRRIALQAFKILGQPLAPVTVPLTVQMIRKETAAVILPGEEKELAKHMAKRREEGVRVNLNHLGEAILGEGEALTRLKIYLEDLSKPEVEYISVKISTIYSQINLLAWNETLEALAERLRELYRAAMHHHYVLPNGKSIPKFVNLDMEEYRDLHLTVALFRKVLDEPEFKHHSAGIVLQSYLPDSYPIQKELTEWAMDRLANGGAPIKIRIVKGANLAMEQFESALRLWPQAPYTKKSDVDANFKRMVTYGMTKEHAQAATLGIGSHNLFDIAYALLLRAENGVEDCVVFEMLEGMADHMRRVVQKLAGGMLLYCPAATQEEFQNAVAYLVRRLDENTAPENFLRHAFDLKVGTAEWQKQADLFVKACQEKDEVYFSPRRTQNRLSEQYELDEGSFKNEADTDWSLPQNIQWGQHILQKWQDQKFDPVPLVISGKEIVTQNLAEAENPSDPNHSLYKYSLASIDQVDEALETAKRVEKSWASTSIEERAHLLAKIAQGLKKHRDDLIGAMVADTGKTVFEADVEISEAIDFANYYRQSLLEWSRFPDVQWSSKGTVVVTPPWNFPCSIPAGGILASLTTGNAVIFKPAPESVLVGWELAKIFWEAGVSKEVLQFITCEDEPAGSKLIQDPRVNTIVLTGATSTAKLFLRMRPGLDLIAETGGKNTMIISAMSDRDLAIKDLIHSAFSHAGQKCSACSLAILEAEVYDDPHFLNNLRDAAASLYVGTPWNLKTKLNPLIHAPQGALLKGLTTLEEGEEWLLEPKKDKNNPNLWSPGIKLGVQPKSFTFQTELFGPVLGLVRADNLSHAFDIMNQTPYGLTAGIHSLDEREQEEWLQKIEAGNCYINRTVTGAVVERQPFGGCKESSFGRGIKAGGPNYLTVFMNAKQISMPKEQSETNERVKALSREIIKNKWLSVIDLAIWQASSGSYAYFWNSYFSKDHDPSLVLGQDNIQRYVPQRQILFRIQKEDTLLDVLRFIAAAMTTNTSLEISVADPSIYKQLHPLNQTSVKIIHETTKELIQRIKQMPGKRVRLFSNPEKELLEAFALSACHLNVGPVLANGRLELLHLVREVSISRDYHRYGNLGDRENELRSPQEE